VAEALAATDPDRLRAIWETAREHRELTQAVKSAVLERKQALDAAPAPEAAHEAVSEPQEAAEEDRQ